MLAEQHRPSIPMKPTGCSTRFGTVSGFIPSAWKMAALSRRHSRDTRESHTWRSSVLGAWVQRGLTSWRERMVYEAEEYHAIINALRAMDKAAYAKAARRHLSRSQRGALDDLAEKRSSEALAGK